MKKMPARITADKISWWPDHLPKVIAFDLDGTLSNNRKLLKILNGNPLRGSGKFGEPNKKVIRRMYALKKLGYKIAIYTARAKSETRVLKRWLDKYKAPYNYLWLDQKPPFIILVDDRVVDVKRNSWFKDLQDKLKMLCRKRGGA